MLISYAHILNDLEMEESSSSSLLSMEISEKNEENETANDESQIDSRVIVEEEEIVQEPNAGMLFNSVDEAIDFYKKYAKQTGFPVKKRSSTKGEDGVLRYVSLACARSGTYRKKVTQSGKSRSKSNNFLKPQPSIKTNCAARLNVSICFDGRWRVSNVKLDHNHELSPDKACYFRCNRGPKRRKRKLEVNDQDGSKTSKKSKSLMVEVGEKEKASMWEKEYMNCSEKVSQLQLGEGDASLILKYLSKMQAQNEDFFYSIDFDKENRLRNVFWADARSRAAYEEFGDVVRFETTCLRNKYAIPFTPFVGVNHHGHSVLFGCGLISSEDTDTFIWLFKSWLACMSGRAPSGIVTDQDINVEKAVENAFPDVRHNWCLGHIMKKLSEKLQDCDQYEYITLELQTAVYDSLFHAEFEERWNEMIEKYNLYSNEWLTELFNERHRWVPIFVRENFWAGISPSRRTETTHLFFDDHLNSKTPLKQFVKKYENTLRSHIEREDNEDFKCVSSRIDCVTHYDIEKHAQDVYTIRKFKELQSEVTGKMYCDLSSVEVHGENLEYQISEDIMIGTVKKSVNFKVQFRECDNEVKCGCCLFEFKGILCRHALYVLIRHKIHLLPEKYIMRRWRKDVKRCHTSVKIRYDDWKATPEAQRCNKMQKIFNEIKEIADASEDKSLIVIAGLQKLKEELHNPKTKSEKNQPIPELNDSQKKSPELPISTISEDNVIDVSKENQNIVPLNPPYGVYGMGNMIPPFFYGHPFQGNPQAWNGGYYMYRMPAPNLRGGDTKKRS